MDSPAEMPLANPKRSETVCLTIEGSEAPAPLLLG